MAVKKETPKATTIEARQDQLIALAVDNAERQLRNNTASSQVITHYLKQGTPSAKIEHEILIEKKKLIQAQTESLKSSENLETLYNQVLIAIGGYKGNQQYQEDNNR